ncbi:hypothetical protein [Streptomyces sp. NRRL B-3648]|uniref:hypothetical protein n=1 Tax=Streptomyces sp. NRRL B-3648 TaxID=1519493 RepID=UPI003B63ECF4
MAIMVNRTVLAHRLFTGFSQRHLARPVEELETGRGCRRLSPAGFVNRLVATLIHLRHDLPHAVPEAAAPTTSDITPAGGTRVDDPREHLHRPPLAPLMAALTRRNFPQKK